MEKDGDYKKKKGKCNYCRELGHYIKDCPKSKEKEAKKESGMAIADASLSFNAKSTNFAQDIEWAFSM